MTYPNETQMDNGSTLYIAAKGLYLSVDGARVTLTTGIAHINDDGLYGGANVHRTVTRQELSDLVKMINTAISRLDTEAEAEVSELAAASTTPGE